MRLSVKIFLLIFLVAFTISGSTGSFFYYQAKNAMLDAVREQLQTAATTFSRSISGDDLEELTEPEHIHSSEYREIQQILYNITQTNDDFLFAYTMRMQDGEVVFVVDSPASDDTGDGIISEDEMPESVGAIYPDPPATLLNGFVRPSADDQPFKDQWGWTISGYAPIQDAAGKNVGLLGIDMCLDRYNEKLNSIKMAGILSLAIALFLAAIFTYFLTRTLTRPLKALEAGFEQVVKGDLETRLEVRGNDEIAQVMNHFNHMVKELREKQLLKSTLGKLTPKGILPKVISKELKLGGETAWTTILFCDLRNFTSMSEKLPPKILVSLLNEYFTVMVGIVEKHSGIVDKFVGDKLMAVFGHPAPTGQDHLNALNAGLEMLEKCDELNVKLGIKDNMTLENSIGIHSGHVLAGNIGSPERMEFTIIGDAVNIAARLEAATRSLKTRLALSEQTADKIKPMPENLEYIGEKSLEGRTEKIGVYILKHTTRTDRNQNEK